MSDHRRPPLPHWNSGERHCRWCGEAITHGRKDRRWHDGREDEPRCVQAYNTATNHDSVRARAKREGWYFCVECGRPGPGLHGPQGTREYSDGVVYATGRSTYAAIVGSVLSTVESQMAGGEDYWRWSPPWTGAWACTPMIDRHVNARRNATSGWARADWRSTTLEVDHIVPLVDAANAGLTGMQPWDLGNVQLLCVVHHKAKTAREAGARAARRRAERGAPEPAPRRPRREPDPTLF